MKNQKLNNFLASTTEKPEKGFKYVSEAESKYICNHTNSF